MTETTLKIVKSGQTICSPGFIFWCKLNFNRITIIVTLYPCSVLSPCLFFFRPKMCVPRPANIFRLGNMCSISILIKNIHTLKHSWWNGYLLKAQIMHNPYSVEVFQRRCWEGAKTREKFSKLLSRADHKLRQSAMRAVHCMQ